MRIEDDGFINESPRGGRGGPLCPRGIVGPGRDPSHAARDRVLDSLYAVLPKADHPEELTSQLSDASEQIYQAVETSDAAADEMRLYRMTFLADSYGNPGGVAVEALYFMCPVCGFTLAANRVPVPPRATLVTETPSRRTDTPLG